jgi:putative DNA primase/helicase
MKSEKKPFHETVAEKLIEQLRAGTAPWQKPWVPGEAGVNMPINPTTGKRYKGINALQLMSEGRDDQRWMTYKQAAAMDAQVRKGEKGTPIQFWKFDEDQTRTDGADIPILDDRGKPIKASVKLERPQVFFATVFNAEQIDGLPPREAPKPLAWNPVERAEHILKSSGATIAHGERDRAYYRPASDSIHLPEKTRFATADNYYATALHELGHWTGHAARLNRDLDHPFGSDSYAKEELRAEIASMILGDQLGIGHDPAKHAAYVGSWIKALQDNPLEIFRAAADAEKIQDYVMGLEQKQIQEATNTTDQLAIEQVAGFLAANHNLIPEKIAENALNAEPALRATLADADRMAAIGQLVDARLAGINEAYIAETKAVIATALQRDDMLETVAAASAAKSQLPSVQRNDDDEAAMVAEFIGANVNLLPWKITENTQLAPAPLLAVLADEARMTHLEGRVNALLEGINDAHVANTKAIIATTLGRPDSANATLTRDISTSQASHYPDAFVDTKGALRDWNTAEKLPPDWQGVVKNHGAYWHVSADTFTALEARTVRAAKAEAAMFEALRVDIDTVLDKPELAPLIGNHAPVDGNSFLDLLRANGLTTVGSITGSDPAKFHERAVDSLSSAYRMAQNEANIFTSRVEQSDLAHLFAIEAEQIVMTAGLQGKETDMLPSKESPIAGMLVERTELWTLGHVENGTFARMADKASATQLDRMLQTLTDMTPVSADRPFWQRHEPPSDLMALQERIDKARELVEIRLKDAPVIESWIDPRVAQIFAREVRPGDLEAFDRASEEALGFRLPHDWNGSVRVQGNVTEEINGELVVASAVATGRPADTWGVYAERADGAQAWLAEQPSEAQAEALAERLAYIDARTTFNEHEEAAKLASINEARVKRDPNSTDEDIALAREARKDAEFTATTQDPDLRRRIAFEDERARAAAVADQQISSKSLIDVPYKQKDEAKAMGAKWDRHQQSWYVPAGVDPVPFTKWAQEGPRTVAGEAQARRAPTDDKPSDTLAGGRQYLAVPYSERFVAKAAGATWDKAAKSWYAGPDADMATLQKWKPEKVRAQQEPAMTPREEFADALKSIGCVISGDHPVMDGKTHRITVDGEKFSKNSGSGFYVGHVDGHPAGYMKNNKTGAEVTWKAKGYTLEPQQKALIAAEAAVKLRQRDADLMKRQDRAAERVTKQMTKLVPIERPTPYMLAKRITPEAGAMTDKEAKKTYLPAIDSDGKQWSMQYIQEDGTKRFAKESRKEGCFHVVGGGLSELAKAPALVLSEGYATAASLKQSLGFPTVSAFDSGNLPMVALALRHKFPDKPLVIAGDDDRHLELAQGVNPGRRKAEEAAKLAGGTLVLPIFAPGESSYPAGLDAVTPAKFREHALGRSALSDEQLSALTRMKEFTDFNDLATKSALGKEGIDRQVRSAVDDIIAKHGLAGAEQQLAQSQGQGLDVIGVPVERRSVKIA